MTTTIVLGALALVVGAILYAAYIAAWRIFHSDGRLRLRDMLATRGTDVERVLTTGSYAVAAATRRCVACRDKETCDAWFAGGGRGSVERFCPNAQFLDHAARER